MESRTENELLFASMFEGKTIISANIYKNTIDDNLPYTFGFELSDGTFVLVESATNMTAAQYESEKEWTTEDILNREG